MSTAESSSRERSSTADISKQSQPLENGVSWGWREYTHVADTQRQRPSEGELRSPVFAEGWGILSIWKLFLSWFRAGQLEKARISDWPTTVVKHSLLLTLLNQPISRACWGEQGLTRPVFKAVRLVSSQEGEEEARHLGNSPSLLLSRGPSSLPPRESV